MNILTNVAARDTFFAAQKPAGFRMLIDRKCNQPGIVSSLIVDNDEYFRIALRNILSARLGVTTITDAESFDGALNHLSNAADTELVVFELGMLGIKARGAIRTVRTSFPNTHVVIVSTWRNRQDVLNCLEAGAHGYVHKGIGPSGLTAALRLICEGTVVVPAFLPDLQASEATTALAESAQTERDADILQRITPRQIEVLRLLVAGLSNKGIARELGLSESAVKFHLSALFRHFGANNRVEAATQGSKLLTSDLT